MRIVALIAPLPAFSRQMMSGMERCTDDELEKTVGALTSANSDKPGEHNLHFCRLDVELIARLEGKFPILEIIILRS